MSIVREEVVSGTMALGPSMLRGHAAKETEEWQDWRKARRRWAWEAWVEGVSRSQMLLRGW